jgi:hypothetical protein
MTAEIIYYVYIKCIVVCIVYDMEEKEVQLLMVVHFFSFYNATPSRLIVILQQPLQNNNNVSLRSKNKSNKYHNIFVVRLEVRSSVSIRGGGRHALLRPPEALA